MTHITEEWKPVVGFENHYEVSSLGAIRRLTDGLRRGIKAGFVIKQHVIKSGYVIVGLYNRDTGKRHSLQVHNIVTAAFLGPKPRGMQVNHIDGNKQNRAASNFEYVTASENQCHANRIGLRVKKLSPDKVREMRLLDGTMSYVQMGKLFEVSDETARQTCHRTRWGHID